LLAPYTPFITEEVHQNLVRAADPAAPASVHWCDYPEPNAAMVDETLERSMDLVLRIVNLGRSARSAASLRVRQPLRRVAIAGVGAREAKELGALSDLVLDELNVKELTFVANRDELLTLAVKANFPVLGKKAGGAMKELAAKIQAADPTEVRAALAEGWDVEAGGQRFRLVAEDVLVVESSRAPWAAQADGSLTVAVETRLDDELKDEGLVRELAHRVQALRKTAEFDVTDRIRLAWELSPGLSRACARHEAYLKDEVLAEEIVAGGTGGETVDEWNFDGERARVGIERVRRGG
jgi:isoleucyl-tRNA synthetase